MTDTDEARCVAAGPIYDNYGPVCPYCAHRETLDEPHYYDEDTAELECGSCERAYAVEVYTSTSWTTSRILTDQP